MAGRDEFQFPSLNYMLHLLVILFGNAPRFRSKVLKPKIVYFLVFLCALRALVAIYLPTIVKS